jgi:hypothetical protein
MIVLLCGYKGCGKDTFANYLSMKYNFAHKKISQPLKEGLKHIFGFTDDQIEGPLKDVVDERYSMTPRGAMIYLGTDIFQFNIQNKIKNIDRNFWVKQLVERIASSGDENVVVSDLRFWHELNYLKSTNRHDDIVVVKIVNPSLQIFQKDADQSEVEHLDFRHDFIIQNTDDDEYYTNIDNLMKKISIS